MEKTAVYDTTNANFPQFGQPSASIYADGT
jgi:hypothetical protein